MTGRFGGANRHAGGGLSRFLGTSSHADRDAAALPADHPAITEGRTLFPRSVVAPAESPRLLVSGINSAKIGKQVRKGPWRGLPIFTLTLEERKTCPTTCHVWRECFGNAMPFARRHAADADLVPLLDADLADLLALHPAGIVVRLHVLGDFPTLDYVRAWLDWMIRHEKLRVFGYTHHLANSDIGSLVLALNDVFPDRWAIRRSVPPGTEPRAMQATTVWEKPPHRGAAWVPDGILCPAQKKPDEPGHTAACATCGLCWAPAMRDTRIVFLGHGKTIRKGPRQPPDNIVARSIDAAGGIQPVADRLHIGAQAVARWRATGHVPAVQRQRLDLALRALTPRPAPAESPEVRRVLPSASELP